MTEDRIRKLAEWMGDWQEARLRDHGIHWLMQQWNPLERIQDAWMLVEKMKFYMIVKHPDSGEIRCFVESAECTIMGKAPTAPLAICAAIEKLMEVKP